MQTPQLENGYVKIANEIMDALIRVPIGNANAQVLYAILRKTYGWNKKSDQISISQLEKMCGCSKRTIIYALQNLESKHMIIIKRRRGRGVKNEINEISFNKKHTDWVVQEKSKQYDKVLKKRRELYRKSKDLVVQEQVSGVRTGKKDVDFLHTQKTLYTKDNKNIFKFSQLVPLPDNLFLTDNMKNYILKQGGKNGSGEELLDDFKNWHGAKGSKHKDWTMAFQKWVKKDKEFHPDKYIMLTPTGFPG